MSLNRSRGIAIVFQRERELMGSGAQVVVWKVLCPGSVFAACDSGSRLWFGIICSDPPRPGSLHKGFRLKGNHGVSTYIQACPLWPDTWLTYIPTMMEQRTLARPE